LAFLFIAATTGKQLTVGDVHGDFETETHIYELWGGPAHVYFSNVVITNSRWSCHETSLLNDAQEFCPTLLGD
jgi:hypothetical protein